MTIRSFIDATGHPWDVWEVHSSVIDRRRSSDRRSAKRPTLERRVKDDTAWLAARRKANAWLVFRSVLGRWRLAPVPDEWERLSDVALHQLISRAVRASDQHAAAVRPKSHSIEARQ